jgi:hypothetical protein
MDEFTIDNRYITVMQNRIEFWKSHFNVLYNWSIRFVNDGEHYSMSLYNIQSKNMVIYPCDIDDEDSYILHEVLKMALIVGNTGSENASIMLEDLVTIIKR